MKHVVPIEIKDSKIISDRFCRLCGVNTSLLPESEKRKKDDYAYCSRCEQDGISRIRITPRDFYTYADDYDSDIRLQKEIKSYKYPKQGIAHLHGVRGQLGDMYLDFFCDRDEDEPHFRISMVDDDDPFFGTEVYTYIKADHVPLLLNINDIHIFDGMTEENWKSYIRIIN